MPVIRRVMRPFAISFAVVALSLSVAGPALGASPSGVNAIPSQDLAGVSSSNVAPAAIRRPDVKHGIDVSHWQGAIDWRRVAHAGIRFAIAKATEGAWFFDEYYRRNAARARTNGIRFTAYHFANPGWRFHDAEKEAIFFYNHARLMPRDLVPALDLERSGGLTRSALRIWTLRWLRTVKGRLGVKPIVYTNPSFWHTAMGDTKAIARAGYDVLWLAHYATRRPAVPASGWDGNGWTIWQWTKCGYVPGVYGCVDRDALTGVSLKSLTIAELRRGN